MTKKAYLAAPTTQIFQVNAGQLMAGSPKVVIEDDTLTYDDTPGNASGGLGRRRNDVWEDDFEEEEQ